MCVLAVVFLQGFVVACCSGVIDAVCSFAPVAFVIAKLLGRCISVSRCGFFDGEFVTLRCV